MKKKEEKLAKEKFLFTSGYCLKILKGKVTETEKINQGKNKHIFAFVQLLVMLKNYLFVNLFLHHPNILKEFNHYCVPMIINQIFKTDFINHYRCSITKVIHSEFIEKELQYKQQQIIRFKYS